MPRSDPFGLIWYEDPERYWTYHGLPLIKCPLDLAAYHGIIEKTQPSLIVETGTYRGASALWMAHQLQLLDYDPDARIISIDIRNLGDLPEHDRIDYWITPSSTDPGIVERVKKEAMGERVMVILDSDHNERHVLKELHCYHRLVSKGCYLIVEDTNPLAYREMWVSGYLDGKHAGPAEAIKKFQPTNNGFVVDRDVEPLFSQNPGGYLLAV